MARLHEYQGKSLLRQRGIATPDGRVVSSPEEAGKAAQEIGTPVVIKIQAWTTGRASIGGVKFAESPDEAAEIARGMLGMRVGNFPVSELLVEEKIDIARELFVSLSIDDAARAPVILLALEGGTGIEDRAAKVHRLACDVQSGPDEAEIDRLLADSPIDAPHRADVKHAVRTVFNTAKETDARSLEINPLVITGDGRVLAADCRMAVDDYAVFRHPDLGIDIARELDHPPTELERIAYAIEQRDHRGTFYFAELPHEANDPNLIGFHGAGGGGSMMSMDAVTQEGFTLANFCDTSGNPSAAKVYAAARIILAQPGIVGYFGSGSGVASQEQFWSAYGLAKAFIETSVEIPVVVRLGGNSEDRACTILADACRDVPATVEGYKKDDTPAACAERFAELVKQSGRRMTSWTRTTPAFVDSPGAMEIKINGGTVWIDAENCDDEATMLILRNSFGLLTDDHGKPALAIDPEEAKSKDSEFIALEIECLMAGRPVVFVDLPIPGLDEAPVLEHAGGAA